MGGCLQNPSRFRRWVCSIHQPNGQKTHCNSTVRQSYRSDDLVEKSWTKAKVRHGKKRAAGILKFQTLDVFPSGFGVFFISRSTYSFNGVVFQLTPENVLTMLTVSPRHQPTRLYCQHCQRLQGCRERLRPATWGDGVRLPLSGCR